MTYNAGWTSNLVIVPLGASGQITIATYATVDVILDVVGWYTPPESGEGMAATTVTPAIVAKTDTALGTCNPSPCSALAANTAKRIKVTGVGGVPTSAEAVAVVLHAFNIPPQLGYLVAWKSDPAEPSPTPPTAGDLSWAGEGEASVTAIVPVDANGYITVLASNSADLIVQTVGYYQSAFKTYQYRYAPDGLRTSKTAPEGTVTRFTWDRSGALPMLLAEAIDAPGTANDKTVRYLHGPGGMVFADVTTQTTDVVRYYHRDQLGSTSALTDSVGNVVGTAAYTPYGEAAGGTGGTTPIAWAGEYRDAETGLTYLRARYYDPPTGQFLTRDPIEALTRSAYGYVSNNPINAIDPTGLCGPFGDGGCPGGSLVPDEVSDAVGTAGNKLKGVGQTVARCVGDAITCAENIKIAATPVVAFGATVALGAAIVLGCAGSGGLLCGELIILAGPAVVAGLYATYLLAQDVWFGEGHDEAYHALGGHHEKHGAVDCDDDGSPSW